jgi:excisionase family DNA binding protein
MEIYTTRQAAAKLGINQVTLLKWINRGAIKARKAMIGQGWRFTASDIEAIAAWRAHPPITPLDLTALDADAKTAAEKAAQALEQRKATEAHFASLPPWDDQERARRERVAKLASDYPGIFGSGGNGCNNS